MMPLLIDSNFLKIYSFGLFLALGFIIFTFLFWRNCRDKGIDDEKIFDNVLLISLISFIGARIFFVLFHWNLFSQNILRIFVLWNIPGFSVWGAIFSGIIAFYLYTGKQKIRLISFLDNYGKALPVLMIAVFLAVFFDGSLTGKTTSLFFGLPAVGEVGKRHPVAVYGIILSVILILIQYFLQKKYQQKLVPATIGFASISYIGLTLLILAFFQDNLLYWEKVSVDMVLGLVVFLTPLLGILLIYFNQGNIEEKKLGKMNLKI